MTAKSKAFPNGKQGVGWVNPYDLLEPPPGARLSAALLTTYGAPDPSFLIDEVIARLLGLWRRFDNEPSAAIELYIQLQKKLQSLGRRFIVLANDGIAGMPQWARTLIPCIPIGEAGTKTQHAKLWMFHWTEGATGSRNWLDVVISSCNLTRDAFEGQAQGAWRLRVKISDANIHDRDGKWLPLIEFVSDLRAEVLAKGSRAVGREIATFQRLLARARPPRGVVFLSSSPRADRASMADRLQKSLPSKTAPVEIVSPFIGDWSREELKRWQGRVRASRVVVHTLAKDASERDHPWAHRWTMPGATKAAMEGLTWKAQSVGPMHEEHDPQRDSRWMHGKMYRFGPRVLITSANFSPSAWGRPIGRDVKTKNFELGVLFNSGKWPVPLQEAEEVSWLNVSVSQPINNRAESVLSWGLARWDGNSLGISAKLSNGRSIKSSRTIVDGREVRPLWRETNMGIVKCTVPWKKTSLQFVQLHNDSEIVQLPIEDIRPLASVFGERLDDDTLGDKAAEQTARDGLLLERYGEVRASRGGTHKRRKRQTNAGAESYDVEAIEDARRWFKIIDTWHQTREDTPMDLGVEADGYELRELLSRRKSYELAAGIAYDELDLLIGYGIKGPPK